MCKFKNQDIMTLDNIKRILKEKWEVVPFQFWIPLASDVIQDTCYFGTNDFDKHVSFEKLNSIINEDFNDEIIELNELREFKIYSNLNLKGYEGLDSFFTNENADWVIYITHEKTITFAGSKLIDKIKEQWNDFEKYVNPWTNDYFEKETIKEKEKIWEALSNFYLKYELQDSDYKNISEIFKKSRFSINELMEIDLYEVFPLSNKLGNNLANREGLNKEWLIQKCLRNHYKKQNSLFKFIVRFKNRIQGKKRTNHWQKLNEKLKTNT